MMQIFRNHMKMEAERAQSKVAKARVGTVTSYDASKYAVKVTLQPEGIDTGWIPLTSPWVGNGWGMYAPPSIGDQVEVEFLEGSIETGAAGGRFYSLVTKPLPVPSGEFWLVHATGSFIKLLADGSVDINAPATLKVTGDVIVTGTIYATGDIVDQTGTINESMAAMRSIFDQHKHTDVQSGSDLSGLPTPLE